MINNDMNFFIRYEGKKKDKKNKSIYIYSLVAFVALIVVGSFIYNTTSIILAKNKIKFYEEELAKEDIIEKVKIYEELDRKNNALVSYEGQVEEIIEAIESRQVVDTTILNKISSTLPTEVTVSGISIEKNQIQIKAVSTSRVAIGELENNLRNVDVVDKVHIGSIAGEEEFTFDISCDLKEVE